METTTVVGCIGQLVADIVLDYFVIIRRRFKLVLLCFMRYRIATLFRIDVYNTLWNVARVRFRLPFGRPYANDEWGHRHNRN